MSDEMGGILKHYHEHERAYEEGDLLGGSNPIDQALSAIREAIPRAVELDKEKIAEIIHSKNSMAICQEPTLKDIEYASAPCEQAGTLVKVEG